MPATPEIIIIGQAGRIGAEACLLAASLRRHDPGYDGRLRVFEPQPGPLWTGDPRMSVAQRRFLKDLGAEIVELRNRRFGACYPQGNKIEALATLPATQPFLFLDSDTLITGALSRLSLAPNLPQASRKVRATWPVPPLYGPDRAAIWAAVHACAGHDPGLARDFRFGPEDPRGHLYCRACWITGAEGGRFGQAYADIAETLWRAPPEALAAQAMTPWLDQIALPAALVQFGARAKLDEATQALHHGLDGGVAVHYQALPLFLATAEPEDVAALQAIAADPALRAVLKDEPTLGRYLYGKAGRRARSLFNPATPSPPEPVLRRQLRRRGLWHR